MIMIVTSNKQIVFNNNSYCIDNNDEVNALTPQHHARNYLKSQPKTLIISITVNYYLLLLLLLLLLILLIVC